jgi:hypothetical protein
MRSIFVIAIIALVACIMAIFSFDSSNQVYAYADNTMDAFERKIIASKYIPTIEDDFKDDRVIVTLKRRYSEVNQKADVQKFRTSEHSLAIDSVEDLTYISDPSKIINKAEFAQIFSITLREHSKESVLRAIEELKLRK